MPTASHSIPEILEKLHIEPLNSGACHGDWIANPSGGEMESMNPATGEPLAKVEMAGLADYECVVARAAEAFLEWRMVPAPQRGEIVREIGDELRAHKADLGALVTLEMGKILRRGTGRSAGDDRHRRFRRRAFRASSTASPCTASGPATACTSSGTRWASWA